jgi:hypothetical protein
LVCNCSYDHVSEIYQGSSCGPSNGGNSAPTTDRSGGRTVIQCGNSRIGTRRCPTVSSILVARTEMSPGASPIHLNLPPGSSPLSLRASDTFFLRLARQGASWQKSSGKSPPCFVLWIRSLSCHFSANDEGCGGDHRYEPCC